MKIFTVTGSFNALQMIEQLPLSTRSRSEVLSLAELRLASDAIGKQEFPYDAGGVVFYLKKQPIHFYEEFCRLLDASTECSSQIQIEVFGSVKVIRDEQVAQYIECSSGIDEADLQKLIQRFLFLDYSGYVSLTQRLINWDFFNRIFLDPACRSPWKPYVCVQKVWGFTVIFELHRVREGKFNLIVNVSNDQNPRM